MSRAVQYISTPLRRTLVRQELNSAKKYYQLYFSNFMDAFEEVSI